MGVVLLTGGAGFVGRHIHRALSARGHEVRLVLRRGASPHLARPASAASIVETENLFSEDEAWWAETCRGVDAVIHAAWYVKPGLYLDAPENEQCVAGSLALARGARQAGVPHFIGIGTCFEYRLPSDAIGVDAPLEPSTLYAASKVALYRTLEDWHAKEGGTFSWCRIFYLYGEGEQPTRLAPYIRARLEAGEVARLSAGTQIRDFMDVADAGEAIANVVDTRQAGAINICSGEAVTIRQFAERIADEYGRRDLLAFETAAVHPADPSAVVGIPNAIKQRVPV